MQALGRATFRARRLLALASITCAVLRPAISFAEPGINLSWDDCGTAGSATKDFACDSNTGSAFTLFGSFVPPPGLTEFVGIDASLRVVSSTAELPDWWKHGSGWCRGTTGLSTNFDFTAGPFSCADFYVGQAPGGFYYEVGHFGSNSALLKLQCAVPFENRGPLRSDAEYYAFKVAVRRSRTVGSVSCAGCNVPVTITLDQIQLFQPPELANDPILTVPLDRVSATWIGGSSSRAPSIRGFVPDTGTDSTPVTIQGRHFTGAT